ncbi:MAG: aspartate aminotransferase family protein [Gammaproteobacteria bacterium]
MNVSRANLTLAEALREAEAHYLNANPKSHRQYQQACACMPGGNTRSILFYAPFPLTIARGEGARLWDIDGHRYTDFLGEYSAGLYGHSHPAITGAVQRALADGILFGGPNAYEAKLAALVRERFPSCEQIRFCNSGTEANVMALSATRAITGRSHIMACKGAYHGGVFSFASANTAMNLPVPTVLADFNDLPGTLALIERHAKELAAIIIEPMMGAAGCIPAKPEYLQGLRDAASAHGIILIFDEVMTSRLAPGGLQKALGITPDMTTFGKYVGGGMSFGAFGGRAEIMARFDPRRPDALLHSGTYNNNVLTMTAGYVGLSEVFTPEVALAFNRNADEFRARLNGIARERGACAQVSGVGSLMAVHFTDRPITQPRDADATPMELRTLFHLHMLSKGYYVARRGYLALCLPLEQADYDGFADAFEDFLGVYGSLLRAH